MNTRTCPNCAVGVLYDRFSCEGNNLAHYNWLKCPTCGYCERKHMSEYKKKWGPGFRFFHCEQCGHEWKDASRDWTSPSSDPCPKQSTPEHQYHPAMGCYVGGEPHYEWPTDGHGNLLEGYDYYAETKV